MKLMQSALLALCLLKKAEAGGGNSLITVTVGEYNGNVYATWSGSFSTIPPATPTTVASSPGRLAGLTDQVNSCAVNTPSNRECCLFNVLSALSQSQLLHLYFFALHPRSYLRGSMSYLLPLMHLYDQMSSDVHLIVYLFFFTSCEVYQLTTGDFSSFMSLGVFDMTAIQSSGRLSW